MVAAGTTRGPPHRPADMHPQPPQPPSHGRVLWNNAMVTCLLELRLGLLLPRFAGGSSAQLKDAWNALQLKFALVTNVNLNVQQLKNKYQQLKREYASTKHELAKRSRLERKRAAAAEAREQGGDGDDHDGDNNEEEDKAADGVADDGDEDGNQGEVVLPGYWDIVDKAFSGAEGYDGVELRHRGSSSSTIKRNNKRERDYKYNREAAAGMEYDDAEDEDSDAASSQAAETSRRQSRAGDDDDAPSDSSAPPARQRQRQRQSHPQPQPQNIRAAVNARPAQPVRQASTSPSALHEFYRRLVPTGPSPSPPSYTNSMHYAQPPPLPPPQQATATAPPPYVYSNNPQHQDHQQPTTNSRYPSNDPNAATKKRKIDMAYALISVGESIANAMVESARIMAGESRGSNFYPPPNRPMEGERVEVGRSPGAPGSPGHPTGSAGHPSGVPGAAGRTTGITGPAGATDDLAAMMNTQIQNQVLMLKMLEKSNLINEELLQFLCKNNKSNNSEQSE